MYILELLEFFVQVDILSAVFDPITEKINEWLFPSDLNEVCTFFSIFLLRHSLPVG